MCKRIAWLGSLLLALPMAAAQLPPVPAETGEAAKPSPRLFVAQRVHDLGTIFEGDRPTVRWILENRGNADLVIDRTRATCGCTVVKLADEDKIIPPGESLELQAEFVSTGRHGIQTKYITVYSNDPVEPKTKLEFTVEIQVLYNITPPGMINLHSVRRGQTVARTIDITPTAGRTSLEILDLQVPQDSPLSLQHEPFKANDGTGQRIRMTVGEHVSLGRLTTKVTIKLSVDGVERERVLAVRGQVVGDLTWLPKTVDATRRVAPHGQRFAPVTVRSTDKMPFQILETDAGPLFDVTFEAVKSAPKGTQYSVFITLRDDAPPGPFGTMLEIGTNLLDQPLVRVPVFGIVAPPIVVDPPVLLFRQDGTAVGMHRRLKLQVLPQVKLNISGITCDNDAVTATIDREVSLRYNHIRFLDVRLGGKLPEGTHRAVLTVVTDIEGAKRLEVPVIIEVPGSRG